MPINDMSSDTVITAREKLVVALVRHFVGQVSTNLCFRDPCHQDLTNYVKSDISTF